MSNQLAKQIWTLTFTARKQITAGWFWWCVAPADEFSNILNNKIDGGNQEQNNTRGKDQTKS
jgi:hypothetical protein